MKLLYKSIIVALCFLAIWFSIPFGIAKLINKKYNPDIIVQSVSISSIRCITLHNVSVTKGNKSGSFSTVEVCLGKTISINNGNVNILLTNTNKTDSKDAYKDYAISANNIVASIKKDDITAEVTGLSLYKRKGDSEKYICMDDAKINHPKANVSLYNVCISGNILSVENGSVSPKIKYKDYSINEIEFVDLLVEYPKHARVGIIKYDSTTAKTVNVSLDNDYVTVNIDKLELYHKRIFTSPINIEKVNVSNISLHKPLSSQITVSLHELISIDIDLENKKASGNNTCDNWLNIIPVELKNDQISQMKLKGKFGFELQLAPARFRLTNTCTIDGPTPQFIKELSKPFKYTVYHPNGNAFERLAGPGTSDWVPLDFIDNMATALTITEDPGFWHHKGFIPQALENSLKDNLRLGKFFRGGSTITMQLAKNLWLNRSRTLGRKLQEGILTIALESSLSKEKILELYLNIVEFGPDTYGIGPGCAKFLNKYPGALTLSESLYMASRLPAPNKAYSFESNKGFIQKLINIGVASGKISESDLENELPQENIVDDEESL